MDFSKFKINKVILKHIGYAFGGLVLLLILTLLSLSIYTRHGDSFPLPDLRGLNEKQVIALTEDQDLKYCVIDSVHRRDILPGIIVDQTPKPGAHVKKNRQVFLTINAFTPEKVAVPRVIDYSLRNAKAVLESSGLKLGLIKLVSSDYQNLVLGQRYMGKPIEPGTKIIKGSAIDLEIGNGMSNESISVPYLIGLSKNDAEIKCQDATLNIGAKIYDNSVITYSDSIRAFVWKQNPSQESTSNVSVGSDVDIWLTINEDLIKTDTTSIPLPANEDTE